MSTEVVIRLQLTAVIATYRREMILVDTIRALLALRDAPSEIVVVDQTESHDQEVQGHLEQFAARGSIRWIRIEQPSIPAAMNIGLLAARCEIVMFVDDDVLPHHDLVAGHLAAHRTGKGQLIAGRVVQPWEVELDFERFADRLYCGTRARAVTEFIGCNFSVRRSACLDVGGFDENFVRVAYRYEAEFAHRFLASRRVIWFEPAASLHHLKAASGGTRTFGDFLRTLQPDHAVGAYYFAFRTLRGGALWQAAASRVLLSVTTRHHLRRPWWIPATLVGELRALVWAFAMNARGPRHIARPE